ncbi:MAG: DUF2935 domain-containing protein [Tissierellia bacterium]|nr:DUF2935 domain-containing protein [Tissierellia bacterium]
MLSTRDFIRLSLETHLFFLRIMKEHSFFLQVAFTPIDEGYIERANDFRMEYDRILREVIYLSNGAVSQDVLQSGEVVTPYTLDAEIATSNFTGVRIPTQLTEEEFRIMSINEMALNPMLEEKVYSINERVIALTNALIQFKSNILNNVLTCKMFTMNYPLLIDHIMREAKLYVRTLQRFQNRESINAGREAMEEELFWNRIMAEHAKFIRGLLDPTEVELFNTANMFGNTFDQLTVDSREVQNRVENLQTVTRQSLNATKEIREFKRAGTEGILQCKIKSIIIPLLGDHTIREASHFLRLLEKFSTI